MTQDRLRKQKVDNLIKLLKKGDAPSLAQLRHQLNIARDDLAAEMGVAEELLEMWENDWDQPPNSYQATWKIKLSAHLDNKISSFLGTEDSEIISNYWALIWKLVD